MKEREKSKERGLAHVQKKEERDLGGSSDFASGFVLSDLSTFGILYVLYAYERSKNVDLFNSCQKLLSADVGAIKSILLLTGSWLVVVAVQLVRRDKSRVASFLFSNVIGCGVFFLVIVAFEYAGKFSSGISMVTNDFYMYYFVFIALHGIHVLIGMFVLALCRSKMRMADSCKEDINFIETCGTFWHVVTVIWIMLFPLLYLSG